MSTDRDVTRIVRSWLHEDAHEDADRVLDLVLDLVDTTPQRRASWLARRAPTMNNYARLGLVAAAVLAVVIVGIGLFGRSPDVGPPASSSPSVSASPAAAINPLVGTWLAPEATCAQQVAAVEAAGFTTEQMTSSAWLPDGGCANWIGAASKVSVVFDGLPVAATIRGVRMYDSGAIMSSNDYRVKDATTFELGGHTGQAWEWCITFRYVVDGDQLTIETVDPSCAGTAEAPLLDQIALAAILGTSPFTRQP
jgi:hypothetical protein